MRSYFIDILEGFYIYAKSRLPRYKALEISLQPYPSFCFRTTKIFTSYLANLFKGVSARKLGLECPHLRRKEGIWTRAYFVSTHGHISSETIRKYVEEQTAK